MYSYQVFKGSDHSNPRVEAARNSFGKENTACYVISKNGTMQMIQFAGEEPYPGTGLANSAELHIAELMKEEN